MRRERQIAGAIFAGALLVRLGLFAVLSDETLAAITKRVELSTPLTDYRRLKEGVFLYQHGIPPYDGGVNHQAPLLLAIFALVNSISSALDPLIFALVDVACGYWLWKIAHLKPKLDKVLSGKQQQNSLRVAVGVPALAAALYLFNPYLVLSCLARSTLSFSHLFVLSSVALAMQGHAIASMGALAGATYLSFYPVTLLPAVLLLVHTTRSSTVSTLLRSRRAQWHTGVFFVWLALLLIASRAFLGSWDFVEATYGVILTVPDLTPNVGLFWYYFMEMFDHFRSLFLVVFQMNALLYALPVTYRFQRFPLFSVFVLCGIMSAFKSYPSWGDTVLHLAFLPLFTELFQYLRYSYVIALVYAFSSALAVVFYHVWINLGTGNANFFFAITLVHALGQIMLIVDTTYAMLRREFVLQHPQHRHCKVVQM
ncbi:GPI transamidase subunit PIG-U [Thamnocephalis sphaerospora]|uniref:GPI transamidase subunit PIG-U n=1 Tax=Thamnocephalis sphaerospora TaxID=78915 RepID=A0A4P9XYM3_9FUNG|nr:GPI transamidase subunit PIG-U [Thamnocephalis sphaerospora]|eukprot:RKP11212.1 GPI transamidase subunit PIG-U [Thamnocephalis sphaerospora]